MNEINAKLAPSETRVMEKILEGYNASQIAESLGLSVNTVKSYKKNLYAKLKVHSKKELFALCKAHKN